jgi:hypothetical protein
MSVAADVFPAEPAAERLNVAFDLIARAVES